MSAKLCGCDLEQDYVCEQHRTEPWANSSPLLDTAGLSGGTVTTSGWAEKANANRDAWERAIAIGDALKREATPIEESLIDVQRVADQLANKVADLAGRVEKLQHERVYLEKRGMEIIGELNDALARRDELASEMNTVVEVLSAFVHAPISLSSLQPILNLAYVLNPSLKERR